MPKVKGLKTIVEEHEVEISLDNLLKAVKQEFYKRIKVDERSYISNDDGHWTLYYEFSYSPFKKIREATEEEKLIYESIETLMMILKL